MSANGRATRPGAWDGVAVGLLALALYAVLRQGVFYKVDGLVLVQKLVLGQPIGHPQHPLYPPLLAAAFRIGQGCGWSAYASGVSLSALGAAMGVGLVHLCYRLLGHSRAECVLGALLVGTTPALMFFATVVEIHAVFFVGAASCACAMAALVRRPVAGRAVLLGMLTAVSSGVHATGHLLPILFLSWYLALHWRDGRWRTHLTLAAIAAATHVLVSTLVPFVYPGFLAAPQITARVLMHPPSAVPFDLRNIPAILSQEWIRPYLPLSMIFLAGFWRRGTREQTVAFLCTLGVYLVPALYLTVHNDERGAYLLPLAIPAAHLTVAAVPKPVGLMVAAIALVLGAHQVAQHDQRAPYRIYARDLRKVTNRRRAVLFVGNVVETGAVLVDVPEVIPYLPDFLKLEPAVLEPLLPNLKQAVESFRRQGREVYITSAAVHLLESSPPSGPLVLNYVRSQFRLEEVHVGQFQASRLIPRQATVAHEPH